jgi:hypothetical protein
VITVGRRSDRIEPDELAHSYERINSQEYAGCHPVTRLGCSDDRDLTYFGEAFYRDALPKAQNLQDAFEQAKEAIASREAQEHQKASDPQAYFGSDLQRVLAENPMSPPSVP